MVRLPTCLVLIAALSTVGCHHEHQEHDEGRFAVTSPLREDTELTRNYVAQIRAIQHIELRALEKGYVQGIFVDEGKRVAKGVQMFQILPLIYQAELQKADAEANLLADKNYVSPNELALGSPSRGFARNNTLGPDLILRGEPRVDVKRVETGGVFSRGPPRSEARGRRARGRRARGRRHRRAGHETDRPLVERSPPLAG